MATHEVPFLRDMERETAVGAFKADGMVEHLSRTIGKVNEIAGEALDKARALAVSVRQHDTGPNPDAPYAEVHARLNEIERLLDRHSHGDYHESPKAPKGDKQWTDRILSACVTLALIGIPALILMYGKLEAIQANQLNQQKQLDTLSGIVEKIRK